MGTYIYHKSESKVDLNRLQLSYKSKLYDICIRNIAILLIKTNDRERRRILESIQSDVKEDVLSLIAFLNSTMECITKLRNKNVYYIIRLDFKNYSGKTLPICSLRMNLVRFIPDTLTIYAVNNYYTDIKFNTQHSCKTHKDDILDLVVFLIILFTLISSALIFIKS
jgi:hypothetical protein